MPLLLFRLDGVPEDEADDVRALLSEHRIDYYETNSGRWGISVAGIWLKEENEAEHARRLLDAYQEERSARVRADYDALCRSGRQETLLSRLLGNPLRFLLYFVAIGVILYLTLIPFLTWGFKS